MPNELNDILQIIITSLNNAEKRNRAVYDSALDISDFQEGQSISSDAQRNIFKIREWHKRIEALCTEIDTASIILPEDINAYSGTVPTPSVSDDAEPPPLPPLPQQTMPIPSVPSGDESPQNLFVEQISSDDNGTCVPGDSGISHTQQLTDQHGNYAKEANASTALSSQAEATERAFKDFMLQRGRTEGTAKFYSNIIKFTLVDKLRLNAKLRTNLFEYGAAVDFEPVNELIRSLPNFLEINRENHRYLSTVLNAYNEFLETENKSEDEASRSSVIAQVSSADNGVSEDTKINAASDTVIIHAKRQDIGENIAAVSKSLTPILIFPSKAVVISARLDGDCVAFCAVVNGVAQRESRIEISHLEAIGTHSNAERIHTIFVPRDINKSQLMRFMAWTEQRSAKVYPKPWPMEFLEPRAKGALQRGTLTAVPAVVDIPPQSEPPKLEIMPPQAQDGDEGIEANPYDSLVPAAADTNKYETLEFEIKSNAMVLLGKMYNVRDRNEMFVKVCEVMLLHKPYAVAAFDSDAELNSDKLRNFSYIETEIKAKPKRLSNGLWIETNRSSEDTLQVCKRILEKCGYPPERLSVEFKEESECLR
ncbi:hypothetical protein FACS1894216_15390 [Synergistales bacterium]|nr:hypothetical protein FACS1894216_15390 [Synergistales bacterium]